MDRKKGFTTIDEYIATFPSNVQTMLQDLRQAIRECAPTADEVMSYQMPTFKLHGNLVYFAAFKDHISFFPTASAIEAFKGQLAKYAISKGTVRFPLTEPMPLNLVKAMVKFRVKENLSKKRR